LALATETLRGPVNVVSPQPVRNIEFTKTLANALHRPAFFMVPKFAIKLLMGEMGEEALLCSFRVRPAKLEQIGFHFQFPELQGALEQLLCR
jgi:NAD dependent epimerase/dehydratase family enzyme